MSDDIFISTDGNDIFNGGMGTGTVTLAGEAAGYRIDTLVDGRVQIVDIDSSDGDTGTDILSGIEILGFADKNYMVGIGVPAPVEFRVDSGAFSRAPAVTALADGGYVITWQAEGTEGDGDDIYAQRFDANGRLGSETLINTYFLSDQSNSAITALVDGGYVITWDSFGQDGDSGGVYAQRFDAAGDKVGDETRVNTHTENSQFAPAITALADGGYVIAWESSRQDDPSQSGVYAQRYDAAGNSVGGETLVNSTTEDYQGTPVITALADGGYIIAWFANGWTAAADGVFGQRFDADGNKVGGETRLSPLTADFQRFPSITALADGGYIVAWDSQDVLDGEVFAQRFDAAGSAVGAEIVISTHTSQYAPVIASLADGGFVMTWAAWDPDQTDIIAQRFDASGNEVGGETVINTIIAGSQYGPAITALADGGYLITWQSSEADGSNRFIYAQRFDAEDRPWEGVKVSGTADGDEITGGSGRQMLYGLAGDDQLAGGDGNDLLDGGTGTDTLAGGEGDDTYVLTDSDTFVEGVGRGIDTVQAGASYTLGVNLDNLVLTGSAAINGTGNSLDNILTGNSAKNILRGGMGNDTLDGQGGADSLLGGKGNDTYVLLTTGSHLTEDADEGIDQVLAKVSWTLGANLENLTLTGFADINGTGNDANNVLIGNSGNNILRGGLGNDTLNGKSGSDDLRGGEGDDTYVLTNADILTENVDEGTDLVLASSSYILGDNLENLTLTGTAAVNGTGNALDNILTGNSGNNILKGGAGSDQLRGGLGDDTYALSDSDVISESLDAGNDTVQVSFSYVLGDNLENLTLTGAAAINGTGNDANNVIIGNGAGNVLSGGDGSDELRGGGGNDTYILADNDVVTELASQGNDTVKVNFSYTLGGNLENLTLTGAAAISGTGNTADNIIIGNAASNALNGGGGADHLSGGLGDDVYLFVGGNDTVIESADGGMDSVLTSISYTLGANVENLSLAGSTNISGTGNQSNNTIRGSAGNNILDGGAGADILRGDVGNDTYILNDKDTVEEEADAGIDTVKASITYALGENLENLTLTGSANINATGNFANNTLIGNAGNNILYASLGLDQLSGGLGDDTYILIDNDAISESVGGGIDTVQAQISYTLGANLENLTLVGLANLNGTGNALNNIIVGSLGNNVLSGGAGADRLSGDEGNDTLVGGGDSDTLTGGDGADAFRFTLSGSGHDTITDYRAAADHIEIADATLKALTGAGSLGSKFFRASASGNAADANDFLLYETDTGKLFHDADGNGNGAKVLIAIIGTTTHPTLTASEIVVI